MSSTDERVLSTLRRMAWYRAKGEIQSMLTTYYGELDRFEDMEQAVKAFVSHVEGEGLHE